MFCWYRHWRLFLLVIFILIPKASGLCNCQNLKTYNWWIFIPGSSQLLQEAANHMSMLRPDYYLVGELIQNFIPKLILRFWSNHCKSMDIFARLICTLRSDLKGTVVLLSVESYTSYWGFLCNIQLPVILTASIWKYL